MRFGGKDQEGYTKEEWKLELESSSPVESEMKEEENIKVYR